MNVLIKLPIVVYFQLMISLKEDPMAPNLLLIKREILKKQLIRESTMVATDSMAVLEEFEKFEESFAGENSGNQE